MYLYTLDWWSGLVQSSLASCFNVFFSRTQIGFYVYIFRYIHIFIEGIFIYQLSNHLANSVVDLMDQWLCFVFYISHISIRDLCSADQAAKPKQNKRLRWNDYVFSPRLSKKKKGFSLRPINLRKSPRCFFYQYLLRGKNTAFFVLVVDCWVGSAWRML